MGTRRRARLIESIPVMVGIPVSPAGKRQFSREGGGTVGAASPGMKVLEFRPMAVAHLDYAPLRRRTLHGMPFVPRTAPVEMRPVRIDVEPIEIPMTITRLKAGAMLFAIVAVGLSISLAAVFA